MSDADTPKEDEDRNAARLRRLTRREPPEFRRAIVAAKEEINPYMMRVSLSGDELAGLSVDEPAASVRVLLPSRETGELVMPEWNGNEFLLPDGSRPPIRTFTPSLMTDESLTCDIYVVIHDSGKASEWATSAERGSEVAVSGPGRGYEVDDTAPAYLLGGDQSAIPAITQILETMPQEIPTRVFIEVVDPETRMDLPPHPHAEVSWLEADPGADPGAALVDAVTSAPIDPDERVWMAGEAAAVQRIRRHLFDSVGLPRSQTTVRGYWKHGREGT